jgi:hypothetical protein
MFKSVSQSLTLKIGAETYKFRSEKDLEFALAGRTAIPASKFMALSDLGDDALLKEADGIRQVERRFADVLSRAMEGRTQVGGFLKELDLNLLSQDNDWRLIVESLNRLDSNYEDYKKLALIKYMQYLASRQEVVQFLYASRREKKSAAAPLQPEAIGSESMMRDTLLLDLSSLSEPRKKETDSPFDRLPKGETIDVALSKQQTLAVLLGKHRFQIVLGSSVRFIDEGKCNLPIKEGKNIVGRDTSCDVIIDSGYRDISRKHLIIEKEGAGLLKFTDISSLGTFLPPDCFDRTNA